MELLEFKRLREKFEFKETQGSVKITLFSKEKDEITVHSSNQAHSSFVKSMNPRGFVGEIFTNEKDIFVCIGKAEEEEMIRKTNVQKSMKNAYETLKRFNKHEITFEESDFTQEAVYSLILTSYNYDFLKKTKDEFVFYLNAPNYKEIITIAHWQNVARFLGDTPANLMTPTLFVEYAKKIFEGDKVVLESLDRNYMKEKNMNLILSVAQGSVEEPKLLSIKYEGKGSGPVDIAFVGKGVCFDSGGISIKPSSGMYLMKQDMMGAATLLCTLKIAVELNISANFSATFPLVENLPSGTATKPGDVFVSMSGTSVEVDNTDAEGRLILADALSFAQLDKPKYLIDAATLTGAMVISLGSVFAGFFTDDDALAQKVYSSGVETYDLLWRMPLSPYYVKEMKSHVADLNNMGGRDGGSCKAAGFLKEFVDTKSCSWIHFDIAGMMEKSYNSEMLGNQATGRPIRAFTSLIRKLATNK